MIAAGQEIDASDFIASSAGAGDSGKAPKVGSDGQLDITFVRKHIKFGGTGADGALSISSGTTTLNAAGAKYLIKNYTSISITGTAVLTISNPSANGTILILKSQGNVTITSSANPCIDLRSMGADAGNDGVSTGDAPTHGISNNTIGTGTLTSAVAIAIMQMANAGRGVNASLVPGKLPIIFAGAGGGNGSGHSQSGGNGAKGGGGLYIECGGALNITAIFNNSGAAGSNGTGLTGSGVPGSGGRGGGGNVSADEPTSSTSTAEGDGGGGGGAGAIVIIYSGALTANTATFTANGGAAGLRAGGSGNNGTAGGAGYSLVIANTEIV